MGIPSIPSSKSLVGEKQNNGGIPKKVDEQDLDGALDRICGDRCAIVTIKGSSQYGDKLDDPEDRPLAELKDMLSGMVPKVFRCSICLENHEDSVARVDGCDHPFCRECLRDYVKCKVAERRFPIMCPVCVIEEGKRDPGVVNDDTIRRIEVSNEDYEIFEELRITSFCVPLHCRRCQQTMFIDRQKVQEVERISCSWPGCGYVWCKACQQEIEAGTPQHSCDGSAELRLLMEKNGWKNCPGCQTPVEKLDGCNFITCITPSCNTHFCYAGGDVIIKGGTLSEILSAKAEHFSRCGLVDRR